MAIRAIFRCRFVEQNLLALDLLLQCVAHRAGHIRVAACQWELRSFIVVKRGGSPALIHVTILAPGNSVFGHKLAAVRIRMAGFAFLGRSLELNFVGAGEDFVAFAAGDAAVSS